MIDRLLLVLLALVSLYLGGLLLVIVPVLIKIISAGN